MKQLMSDMELASLALAGLVLLVAVLLGYREWRDRQRRPWDLADEDLDHFQRRDRRRSAGLSVLCILAVGIVVGSRTPPRIGPQPNSAFLLIWLGIFALISLLLMLAMLDWVDLRRYAQHKKKAIGREHLAIIQADIDQWKAKQGEGGEAPDIVESNAP